MEFLNSMAECCSRNAKDASLFELGAVSREFWREGSKAHTFHELRLEHRTAEKKSGALLNTFSNGRVGVRAACYIFEVATKLDQ